MTLRFPPPLDRDRFLTDYWQRRPLLLDAALPAASLRFDADVLAGLACEERVESRLVVNHGRPGEWQLRHGPFTPADFAALPDRGWTLLVQDVDALVPAVARLLDEFDFLPRWRIEDVMISYAAPGGTVGAHRDEYDVFLLQGDGTRIWETGRGAQTVPQSPLRLLADFAVEERWELQTGDALYLPPGLAHHGYGDRAAMTWSVGLRAPSVADLILARAEHLAAGTTGRYRDAGCAPDEARGGRISRRAVARAVDAVGAGDAADAAVDWFGRLVTESKPWLLPDAPDAPLARSDFLQKRRTATLCADPGARMAWSDFPAAGRLFVDGEMYALSAAVAAALCDGRGIGAALPTGTADDAALYALYRAGKIYFGDDE